MPTKEEIDQKNKRAKLIKFAEDILEKGKTEGLSYREFEMGIQGALQIAQQFQSQKLLTDVLPEKVEKV